MGASRSSRPRTTSTARFRILEALAEHAPAFDELREQGLAPTVAVFRDHEEAREWLLSAEASLAKPA